MTEKRIPNLSVADQMLYCTVKIIAKQGTAEISTGTGFYFNFLNVGGKSVPALVTNKHVLNGADRILVCLHMGDDEGPNGKSEWVECIFSSVSVVKHPSDSIDLCAVLMGTFFSQMEALNKYPFILTLGNNEIPNGDDWENFDTIEDVHMVGCPSGLNDSVNNFPLVRRGITATSLSRRYNGKNEFVIDLACFPGSSGSPLFVYNRDGYLDKKTNSFHFGKVRFNLVGILYAGPLINNQGEIVLGGRASFSVKNMMHLGYVIRADEIKSLEREIAVLLGDQDVK